MLKRFAVATSLLIAGGLAASAEPPARPGIVLVSGGCGLAFHRNVVGACVPNGGGFYGGGYYGGTVRRLPPPCPRFYHRDPDPARPICYPNL